MLTPLRLTVNAGCQLGGAGQLKCTSAGLVASIDAVSPWGGSNGAAVTTTVLLVCMSVSLVTDFPAFGVFGRPWIVVSCSAVMP